MDNASKALIMAGAVLISIMVISLLMYMLNVFGQYSEKQSTLTASSQNESFNRFFVYSELIGPTIKGYDAANIIAKARDMNQTMDPINQISIEAPSIGENDYESNFTYEFGYGSNGKINYIKIN